MKTKLILFGVLIYMIGFQAVSAQNHYADFHNNRYTGNSVDYYYRFQEKINNAYIHYRLENRDRVLLINELKSLRKLEWRFNRDGYLSQSEFYQLRDRANRIESKFHYLIQRSYQSQYYGNYYNYYGNNYDNYYNGNHQHYNNGHHYGWYNNNGNHYGRDNHQGYRHRNNDFNKNQQNKTEDKPFSSYKKSNESQNERVIEKRRDSDDNLTMKNTKTRELKEENIQWENLN